MHPLSLILTSPEANAFFAELAKHARQGQLPDAAFFMDLLGPREEDAYAYLEDPPPGPSLASMSMEWVIPAVQSRATPQQMDVLRGRAVPAEEVGLRDLMFYRPEMLFWRVCAMVRPNPTLSPRWVEVDRLDAPVAEQIDALTGDVVSPRKVAFIRIPPWIMAVALLREATAMWLQGASEPSPFQRVARVRDLFTLLGLSLQAQASDRFPQREPLVAMTRMIAPSDAIPLPPIDWSGWDRLRDAGVEGAWVKATTQSSDLRFMDFFVPRNITSDGRAIFPWVEIILERLLELGSWADLGESSSAKYLPVRARDGAVLMRFEVFNPRGTTSQPERVAGPWGASIGALNELLIDRRVVDGLDGRSLLVDRVKRDQPRMRLVEWTSKTVYRCPDPGLAMIFTALGGAGSGERWWGGPGVWSLFSAPDAPGAMGMLAPSVPSEARALWLAAQARRAPEALIDLLRKAPKAERDRALHQTELWSSVVRSPSLPSWVHLLVEQGEWVILARLPDRQMIARQAGKVGGAPSAESPLALVPPSVVRAALKKSVSQVEKAWSSAPLLSSFIEVARTWDPAWLPVDALEVAPQAFDLFRIPGALQDPDLVAFLLDRPCFTSVRLGLVQQQDNVPVSRPVRALLALKGEVDQGGSVADSPFLPIVLSASSTALLLWAWLDPEGQAPLLEDLVAAVLTAPWVPTRFSEINLNAFEGRRLTRGADIPDSRGVMLVSAMKLARHPAIEAAWRSTPPLEQVQGWVSLNRPLEDSFSLSASTLASAPAVAAFLEEIWLHRSEPKGAGSSLQKQWAEAALAAVSWTPAFRRSVLRLASPGALGAFATSVDGDLRRDVLAALLAPPKPDQASWLSLSTDALQVLHHLSIMFRLPPLSFPAEARMAFVRSERTWWSNWASIEDERRLLLLQGRHLQSAMALADAPWSDQMEVRRILKEMSRGDRIRSSATTEEDLAFLARQYDRRIAPDGLDWARAGGWTLWVTCAASAASPRAVPTTQTPMTPELCTHLDGAPVGTPVPRHLLSLPSVWKHRSNLLPNSIGELHGHTLFAPSLGLDPAMCAWWSISAVARGFTSWVRTARGVKSGATECAESVATAGVLTPESALVIFEALGQWAKQLPLERRMEIARKYQQSTAEHSLTHSFPTWLANTMGMAWLALTPDDACRWARTPAVRSVSLAEANILFAIPQVTPTGEMGMLVFFVCNHRSRLRTSHGGDEVVESVATLSTRELMRLS